MNNSSIFKRNANYEKTNWGNTVLSSTAGQHAGNAGETRVHSSPSLSSAEEPQYKNPEEAIDASPSLASACERFSKTLEKMRISCFIAIDEARELHETRDHRELLKGDKNEQLSHFLCRVISNLSRSVDCPIWTIFLSTISSLTDFSGSKRMRMCQDFTRYTT